MIRILTKNGVDNTNVDGARDHNFNAGRRSGIVQGALNQGNFFASNNNTIALDTCELRLCGHRIVLDKAEYRTFTNKPSVPVRYSFVARVVVDSDDNVSFEFVSQEATTQLVQDNLDITGSGTYELEIGKFTQLTDGNITDVVRTADLIIGGADNDSDYIRIGTVTTNKISPELDADVDIENTINPTDNKPQTNFTFNLPTAVGTVVSVNGEEKTAINTDLTPTANSENLITSGGVHDYPAITFAESERQKSKNLLNKELLKKGCYIFVTGKYDYNADYMTFEPISVTPNSTITVSCNGFTFDSNCGFVFFNNGVFVGYISNGATVATVPANANQVIYNFFKVGITKDDVQYAQLEYGSVATDYQPYYGQITHNGDKEIEFAEKEYQKSKNVLDINKAEFKANSQTHSTLSNGTITINAGNQFCYISSLTNLCDLKPNIPYTLSYVTNNGYSYIYQYIEGATGFTWNNGETKIFTQTELDRIANNLLLLYGSTDSTVTYSNIQIEEGSVATDYQLYDGEIIHEKKLNEIVNGKYPIDINACTTYDQVFNQLQNAAYGQCGIGVNHTNAIKSLLPTFPTNASYVDCVANVIKNKYTASENLYAIRFTGCPFGVNQPIYYCDVFYDGEHTTVTGWYKPEISDLIYEMNTKNTIGGKPYTAGIPFYSTTISNVDLSPYKHVRFTCRWNDHGDNWFGGTITFDLDLTTPYNSDAEYMSVISNRPSQCYIADSATTFDLVGQIVVNGNKNSLGVNGYKITYTGERTTYTSDNYLPYFRIEKMEGFR